MVGIVIVGHGEMGTGMLEAARMIVGEQPGVMALSLRESDGIDDLGERIAAAGREVDAGQGILIMVDLFGASPFNAGARYALERGSVEILTGLNLPMLLETLVQREDASLDQLLSIAQEAGRSGIRSLPDALRNGKPSSR